MFQSIYYEIQRDNLECLDKTGVANDSEAVRHFGCRGAEIDKVDTITDTILKRLYRSV